MAEMETCSIEELMSLLGQLVSCRMDDDRPMRQSDDTVLCVTELLGRLVLEDDEHSIKRVLRCVLDFLPRLPWREGCPATQQAQLLEVVKCTPHPSLIIEFLPRIFACEYDLEQAQARGKNACLAGKRTAIATLECLQGLLVHDRSLLLPIVGCLSALPLGVSGQSQMFEILQCGVSVVEEHDLPTMVRALICSLNVFNGVDVVSLIRHHCASVASGTLTLILELVLNALKFNFFLGRFYLSSMQHSNPNISELDFFVLMQMISQVKKLTMRNPAISVLLSSAQSGHLSLRKVQHFLQDADRLRSFFHPQSITALCDCLAAGRVDATHISVTDVDDVAALLGARTLQNEAKSYGWMNGATASALCGTGGIAAAFDHYSVSNVFPLPGWVLCIWEATFVNCVAWRSDVIRSILSYCAPSFVSSKEEGIREKLPGAALVLFAERYPDILSHHSFMIEEMLYNNAHLTDYVLASLCRALALLSVRNSSTRGSLWKVPVHGLTDSALKESLLIYAQKQVLGGMIESGLKRRGFMMLGALMKHNVVEGGDLHHVMEWALRSIPPAVPLPCNAAVVLEAIRAAQWSMTVLNEGQRSMTREKLEAILRGLDIEMKRQLPSVKSPLQLITLSGIGKACFQDSKVAEEGEEEQEEDMEEKSSGVQRDSAAVFVVFNVSRLVRHASHHGAPHPLFLFDVMMAYMHLVESGGASLQADSLAVIFRLEDMSLIRSIARDQAPAMHLPQVLPLVYFHAFVCCYLERTIARLHPLDVDSKRRDELNALAGTVVTVRQWILRHAELERNVMLHAPYCSSVRMLELCCFPLSDPVHDEDLGRMHGIAEQLLECMVGKGNIARGGEQTDGLDVLARLGDSVIPRFFVESLYSMVSLTPRDERRLRTVFGVTSALFTRSLPISSLFKRIVCCCAGEDDVHKAHSMVAERIRTMLLRVRDDVCATLMLAALRALEPRTADGNRAVCDAVRTLLQRPIGVAKGLRMEEKLSYSWSLLHDILPAIPVLFLGHKLRWAIKNSQGVACRYMLATYFTALPPSEVTREALNLASKIREFAIDIEKKGALSHCKMFALDSFCAPKFIDAVYDALLSNLNAVHIDPLRPLNIYSQTTRAVRPFIQGASMYTSKMNEKWRYCVTNNMLQRAISVRQLMTHRGLGYRFMSRAILLLIKKLGQCESVYLQPSATATLMRASEKHRDGLSMVCAACNRLVIAIQDLITQGQRQKRRPSKTMRDDDSALPKLITRTGELSMILTNLEARYELKSADAKRLEEERAAAGSDEDQAGVSKRVSGVESTVDADEEFDWSGDEIDMGEEEEIDNDMVVDEELQRSSAAVYHRYMDVIQRFELRSSSDDDDDSTLAEREQEGEDEDEEDEDEEVAAFMDYEEEFGDFRNTMAIGTEIAFDTIEVDVGNE